MNRSTSSILLALWLSTATWAVAQPSASRNIINIQAVDVHRNALEPGPQAGITLNGRYIPYDSMRFARELSKRPNFESTYRTSGLTASQSESRVWRIAGSIGGGFAGFTLYTPHAISGSRINVSNTQRLAEWSLVTAGAAYLGYLIGKKVDRGR